MTNDIHLFRPGPFAHRAPRKGHFTQCVVVLLTAPIDIALVGEMLTDFQQSALAQPSEGAYGWAYAGASLFVEHESQVPGWVQVDVVSEPWPDTMGSASDETANLFMAWLRGCFGVSTYPGALERALGWFPEWQPAVSAHQCFVRVRASHGENEALPSGTYDAVAELRFVTQLQSRLCRLPGAICAFNPNGEVLMSGDELDEVLAQDASEGRLPLDAWAHVRSWGTDNQRSLNFETIGLDQLDIVDHAAVIDAAHESADLIPGLLYSIAAYDASQRGVMGPDETASDLNGHLWRAVSISDSETVPQRPLLIWALESDE